ncbi:MAG: hypothetical protein HKP09_06225 [Enterobacterales bacterium]|nr:hypothetical protein [Enterobacterales bacterium]
MIFKVIIALFSVLLSSCVKSSVDITLGGNDYKIPTNYVVSFEALKDANEFDQNGEMIALSFTHVSEISHLTGNNGWLPRSPVSVVIFNQEIGSFDKVLQKSVQLSDEIQVIELPNVYRIFDSQLNSHWKAINKNDSVRNATSIKTEQLLDCYALGGTKGINSSRTVEHIPTSCKVTIVEDTLVMRISSSEKNLTEHFQVIRDLIISKLKTWKI